MSGSDWLHDNHCYALLETKRRNIMLGTKVQKEVKTNRGDHRVGKDEAFSEWFICPKCQADFVLKGFTYCTNCGVKLVKKQCA